MKSKLLQNKPLIYTCQYLLAALFIFSGVAKAINPFGLSNQFGDYFNAMGLDFMFGSQLFFAIMLPAVEILIGLVLAFGVFRKIAAWVVLLFMGGFTLLTLWIALFNPVSDCGCFGDLLKISNTATFLKNVLFTVVAIIFFTSRNWASNKFGNFYYVTIAIFSFVVPYYFLWTLPPVDATNYKIGNDLVDMLENSEELITLPILTDQGQDIHTELINDSISVIFIVSPKLEDITAQWLEGFVTSARDKGIEVALLTSASIEDADKITSPLNITAYNSDYTVLKTMVQNFQGGAVYLKNGVIEQKWAMSQLPSKVE